VSLLGKVNSQKPAYTFFLTPSRDLLALRYGWFTEGFDTPGLRDAKALLEELA
jgi:hypothetical protein